MTKHIFIDRYGTYHDYDIHQDDSFNGEACRMKPCSVSLVDLLSSGWIVTTEYSFNDLPHFILSKSDKLMEGM